MKKILVPIDFSKPSEYACKMAAKIAQKSDAAVYLLHLVELPTGVVDMGSRSTFSIPESILYLRKLRERIFEYRDNFFKKKIEVHYAIKFEKPYTGILKYVDKINADLIVMGSKGHSDFEEIIIGSNTEKVVRSATTPVIVVKQDTDKFKLENIVFASNFKEKNKNVILNKVLNFASAYGSKIHFLKITTPSKFLSTQVATEQIEDFIKEFNLSNYSINVYNDTSIESGILNFSRTIDADLISLTTHGRSGLSHLFSPSVTKNLGKSALRPILTIRV